MASREELEVLSDEVLEVRAVGLVTELFGRRAAERFRFTANRGRCIRFLRENDPQPTTGERER